MKEKYETFGRMLEDRETAMYRDRSFGEICRKLDVDRERFEAYLFSETGLAGDEVMELYRKTPA